MRRRLRLRVVIPVVVVLVGGAWAFAATRGLEQGAVYYYTPSEVSSQAGSDEVIRVGGQVVPGSVRWDGEAGVLRFMLRDGKAAIPVVNRGAPPDLFRAGADALVEGRLIGGTLRSSDVIVKHDENYRAPATPPPRTTGSLAEASCPCPMGKYDRPASAPPSAISAPRP